MIKVHCSTHFISISVKLIGLEVIVLKERALVMQLSLWKAPNYTAHTHEQEAALVVHITMITRLHLWCTYS